MTAEKALEKFGKGNTRFQSVTANFWLNDLTVQLQGIAKEFFTYPDQTPTPPNAHLEPPLYIGPHNPEGEDLTAISDKAVKQKLIRKGLKNFVKGFKILEKNNKEMYSQLDLHKPLDLIHQYAADLERAILENQGI